MYGGPEGQTVKQHFAVVFFLICHFVFFLSVVVIRLQGHRTRVSDGQ